MRPAVLALALAFALVLGSATAHAQQPTADYYDTTKIVTIKGSMRLNLAFLPPSPMMIMIEVTNASGQKENWVFTGNPATSLRRDGWQLIGPNRAIGGGEDIAVTAYLPKDTQKAVATLKAAVPTVAPGLPGPGGMIADVEAKRAKLAYGLEIIKADGQKLRFGDAQP